MALLVTAPVKNLEMSELTDCEALAPQTIRTMPTTRTAKPANLCTAFSSTSVHVVNDRPKRPLAPRDIRGRDPSQRLDAPPDLSGVGALDLARVFPSQHLVQSLDERAIFDLHRDLLRSSD